MYRSHKADEAPSMNRGGEKPGFFDKTSSHLLETAKNPVSLLLAGPETGFFRELFTAPRRSSQKPGFFGI